MHSNLPFLVYSTVKSDHPRARVVEVEIAEGSDDFWKHALSKRREGPESKQACLIYLPHEHGFDPAHSPRSEFNFLDRASAA